MDQLSFSEAEYNLKKKKTRRERFLEQMNALIPWKQLENKIRRHYPRAGNGRQPYPLDVMLRIHCLQLFYNLSDRAMEEGFSLKEGTIVDATIISAPTSTKNREGEHAPAMQQAKKGNEKHFGMKRHIGTDDAAGCIHSVETTAANAHDITMADQLLHGEERRVWGGGSYVGIEKREEQEDLQVEWFIACRPGKLKALAKNSTERQTERIKAQVRGKVEHAFLYIKRIFGYSEVRYRGLQKNHERLYLLSGFYNLIRWRQLATS